MKKFIFSSEDPKKLVIKENKRVFNFENMYSLYLFKKDKVFRTEITKRQNITFPDGKSIARYLGIKQQRGPSFTKSFLTSKIAKEKKHFFIGNANLIELSKKTGINKRKIYAYNPPFIKGKIEFPEKEKKKIVNLLKKKRPDLIWVCVGNPKQEILANQLYELYPGSYINVGAALDFLLGKKDEAPEFWRSLGLEWFYRLITDFKYSKKKVWGSFLALRYLKDTRLRDVKKEI